MILSSKGAFTLSWNEREIEIFLAVNNTMSNMWRHFHIRVRFRFLHTISPSVYVNAALNTF